MLIGAFNQEKALVGAFSMIFKTDGSFAALYQDHWDTVFWISAAVYTLGTLTFLLLGTAEEQPWNRGEYDKSVGASAGPQQVSQPRQETTTVV